MSCATPTRRRDLLLPHQIELTLSGYRAAEDPFHPAGLRPVRLDLPLPCAFPGMLYASRDRSISGTTFRGCMRRTALWTAARIIY
jgi:hypothetical protein